MLQFEELRSRPSFPELMLEKAMNGFIDIPAKASNPALSPSGLGCQRAAAFKLSGAVCKKDEETYESALAAEMGSFIHRRIQKFLSASAIWVDVEEFVKQHPELGLSIRPNQRTEGEISLTFSGIRNGKRVTPPFSFQCDGIVFIDGEYYLVEIKTEREQAWEKRTAPNPKHASQATGYSFLYGIKKVLWVYASRESFGVHRKVYLQQVEDKKVEDFVSVCQSIGTAVENKDIASLPKSSDCRYCAFIEHCKAL